MGLVLLAGRGASSEPNTPPQVKAVVIPCKGMIDDGLYQSIHRRTELAIEEGARYIIYEISTYGGMVESADSISKYMILDVAPRAHTVAYISAEAISAGAMISVSCKDIVMREHTTIGDCAPISMGDRLEGIEREKAESFIRVTFDRAAKANAYPQALLRAMVTREVQVYQVKNMASGRDEYFEAMDLPKDANAYGLADKRLVDPNDRLLTVDAETAFRYGIARAVVPDLPGALAFLAQRDGVLFQRPLEVLNPNWSEQMVRKVNHPAVIGVLMMIALLGLYMELSTPGLGLPGLVSVICFSIIIGSKYLIGLANWLEVAVFAAGIILLAVELFLLPGFGIAGLLGILCMAGGLFGMLVRNPPGQWPWPDTPVAWMTFTHEIYGLAIGVVGFMVLAVIVSRYLPRIRLFSGLILAPTAALPPAGRAAPVLKVGARGLVISTLRPVGRVRFQDQLVDCVAHAEFIEPLTSVEVVKIDGNRVVVRPVAKKG